MHLTKLYCKYQNVFGDYSEYSDTLDFLCNHLEGGSLAKSGRG